MFKWATFREILLPSSGDDTSPIPFPGLTPDFHAIFHIISVFDTNKNVTKIDCKSLGVYQKKVYDKAFFSKVTNR